MVTPQQKLLKNGECTMKELVCQPMFNIFCRDIDRQLDFYKHLLGWDEIKEASSPIYRVLTGAGVQLGFNGWMAYDLLSLADRIKPEKTDFPINTMITFMVEEPELVDGAFRKITEWGGRVVKAPFATYYGHWQIVFCDPENNVVRITSSVLPEGIQPPAISFE